MEAQDLMKCKTWVVVGASQNADKFGNKIYKRLKAGGYEVYPVNPFHDTVEGDVCYKNLSALPKKPDVINMVVSPERGIPYIKEAANLGVKNIWLQPGTVNDELLSLSNKLGLNTIEACVLEQ